MPIITHNGEFTIQSPRDGQPHKTFRIHTVKNGALKGKRLLALLDGPDNIADYIAFGEVTTDGNGFYVWQRFQGVGSWEMYAVMLRDLMRKEHSQLRTKGYELLESTVCRVCNRKLTTPDSIRQGIGPECIKRL